MKTWSCLPISIIYSSYSRISNLKFGSGWVVICPMNLLIYIVCEAHLYNMCCTLRHVLMHHEFVIFSIIAEGF